jgi:hypothetical protein
MIVALDEVGSGHDLASYMEWDFWQYMTLVGVISLFHLLFFVHECFG